MHLPGHPTRARRAQQIHLLCSGAGLWRQQLVVTQQLFAFTQRW